MVTMQDPLVRILGPAGSKKFGDAFGYQTVGDVLRHYPRRYQHRGELTELAGLREGEHVTVLAQVVKTEKFRMKQRKGEVIKITVSDGASTLLLTFFAGSNKAAHYGPHSRLTQGTTGLFSGEVSTFRNQRQLVHPDFEPLDAEQAGTELAGPGLAEYAAAPIPVYPATAKLPS
jgi:ATP-dependent DNA helicase RecG